MATILIVDDDSDTRELLGRYLHGVARHHTLLAADGLEALEALAREPIDLVVLDLLMPRMGGAEFLAAIRSSREAWANVPVFVCSAMGRGEIDSVAELPGVTGVLYKDDGFFIDLIDVVTRHVSSRPSLAKVAASGADRSSHLRPAIRADSPEIPGLFAAAVAT